MNRRERGEEGHPSIMLQQSTQAQLHELHDIVLPEPVSWMPQTWGWGLLLALAVGAGLWAGRAVYRRSRANRFRREALARLGQIETAQAATRLQALAELPSLLKQTALCGYPRSEVASLSGEAWLRFLDRSYGGDGFSNGPGRLLTRLAYEPLEKLEALSQRDWASLIQLIRDWIRTFQVEKAKEKVQEVEKV